MNKLDKELAKVNMYNAVDEKFIQSDNEARCRKPEVLTEDHFIALIEGIKRLGAIKSVAWHTNIDDTVGVLWQRCSVRFEDEDGYVLEIPYVTWGNNVPEFCLINLALQRLWKQIGEDGNENWIFTYEDFERLVNKARSLKPYTGQRLQNQTMYEAGWEAPNLIF